MNWRTNRNKNFWRINKIKISEEPMEIKSPEKDENVTGWYDKKKFKKY